jgi:tetratricopeptide (TPR) repeat protein
MVKKLNLTKSTPEAPAPIDPKTADEFTQRGWDHYTKKEFFRAENDFFKALELSPQNPDILYALGMTLQASGRSQDAIAQFEKLIILLQEPAEEDQVRARMLVRLARGHINRIKTGDWHLEE